MILFRDERLSVPKIKYTLEPFTVKFCNNIFTSICHVFTTMMQMSCFYVYNANHITVMTMLQ